MRAVVSKLRGASVAVELTQGNLGSFPGFAAAEDFLVSPALTEVFKGKAAHGADLQDAFIAEPCNKIAGISCSTSAATRSVKTGRGG